MVNRLRVIGVVILCILGIAQGQAQKWRTHFAYNNVTQIAMSDEAVYAVSDGRLYSVDKISERLKFYDRQSGLHGTDISCIHYDEIGNQLIIGYNTGMIDVISAKGKRYVGELYDKDMTQRKTIQNITIHGRTAYLSTPFGVQTMDLREMKMVDSYWLRPGGEETDVMDVVIANDSIYAFTSDSMFCASIDDNLVDYTRWQREQRTGRVAPDPNKGTQYDDGQSVWYAGNTEGIVRFIQSTSQRMNYIPDGPIVNTPYRITATQGKVWVVSGGRWAEEYAKPGHVMIYDGERWTNIWAQFIKDRVGGWVLDMMNVAVDPEDNDHYFVTSYGTGLYEFRGDSAINKWITDGTTPITAAAPSNPLRYTRLNYATYDPEGHLWFTVDGTSTVIDNQLVCLDKEGEWHGLRVTAGSEAISLETSTGLIIDHLRPNYKWFSNGRGGTGFCLLDDSGTRWDATDDRVLKRVQWTDQDGNLFHPENIYDIAQDSQGRIWIGTDIGAAYITPETDFFSSDAIVRMTMVNAEGDQPLMTDRVQAFCETPNGDIWIGTLTQGVYVLNSEATEIKAHYSIENSAMPSNGIFSLACNEEGIVWIGTEEGLVECDPNGSPEGLTDSQEEEQNLNMGSMEQWRLHLSYNNASRIEASPSHIYAIANGSLFSYDRADGTLNYWNRSNGLNGMTVVDIAYDKVASELIIVYDDGRIDLMRENGEVQHMPDLYMKAGSMAVTPNGICVGSQSTYLAMSFGIVALDIRKKEVKGTYYIGDQSTNVNVTHIVEKGDSLFAFAEGKLYSAALTDNMDDYHYWHSVPCPLDPRYVGLYRDHIYALGQDSILYIQNGGTWQPVRPEKVEWIHICDNRLLLCLDETKLYELTEEHQLSGICDRYIINDAIYTQGEYWLGERYWGLIHLGTNGDDYYHTEGPNSNFSYHMVAAHGQIYSVIGGRWGVEYVRFARMNIFNGSTWRGINEAQLIEKLHKLFLDPVSIAVDPQDPGHFFVATYGTGVIEFRDYNIYTYYSTHNSTLREVLSGIDKEYYTRTDGLMMDNQGNLWVMNATEIGQPLHILQPNGQWYALKIYSSGNLITFSTPAGIWVDRRNEQRKWMFDQRATQGVILLDDGGTPTNTGDDRCIKRSSFLDQDDKAVAPSQFRCWAQDKTNRIWIGTDKGLFTIPASVDFFTSNACRRIIIPRNDGTNLGDYLLGEEQINCMAVDGGNRMWIGTATSGLYVIEDDTITVAHFTENNSLLPANSILSIAIDPTTGEVFVGTDKGIASYRSDSSEPQSDMRGAYAFPNPVRPDYGGMISIVGLMDNTVVNIIDAGGNLVCKTKSHGGTAVWDGKLPDGRRATPGVYTALCNAESGHTVVKILVAY